MSLSPQAASRRTRRGSAGYRGPRSGTRWRVPSAPPTFLPAEQGQVEEVVEAGVEVVAEVAAARGVPGKRPAHPRLERPLAASEVDGLATTMNTAHGPGR